MIEVRCGFGLGNRVAALANGLSRADRIRFVWRVNAHCPLLVSDVFPAGISGVDLVTDAPAESATRWDSRMCHDWDAAADRGRADAAYARIIAAMNGRPTFRPDLAVVARFHRATGDPADHIARLAATAADWIRPDPDFRVFVFADQYRYQLAAALTVPGVRPTFTLAPELPADLARTPADTATFLLDWKTLLSARRIIALDGPTSLLHPARAAGIPIHYATAVHRSCNGPADYGSAMLTGGALF